MKMAVGCLVWILMQSYVIVPLRAQERLEKVEVFALNIAARYERLLTVSGVINHPRRSLDTINNTEILAAIERRLLELRERRTVESTAEPHIVCFVYWNGRPRDTLLFGKQQVWYDGRWRDQDPVLLWLMSVKFPQEYLQGVMEEIMTSERLQRIQQKKQE